MKKYLYAIIISAVVIAGCVAICSIQYNWTTSCKFLSECGYSRAYVVANASDVQNINKYHYGL